MTWPDGRVLIAFDDDPYEPAPSWTRIDAPGGDFPDQFVASFNISNGKQSLLQQTDTGTAGVYINDHKYGLFDPRNASSPYYQKLDGKQILLQLYDPVREVWEPQFRGHIDYAAYALDGSGVNSRGEPLNASIVLNCVDLFDTVAGYGLTPGLDGVRPPSKGADNGVWYAQTAGEAGDRVFEVLADVGIDTTQSVIFSGNVALQTVKYDPDESALVALRDISDAEFPFISNLYVDRYGRVVWHGRYGRFAAADVAAFANLHHPGEYPPRWNWHHWKLGDGAAVASDATRCQMRVLEFDRGRTHIINVATCYPANMNQSKMKNQVYADVTSIDTYGQHAAPPMSDLLTANPINDNLNGHPDWTRYDETFNYAKLLVVNQKDPRENITALQVKTVDPSDDRASEVWAFLTQADVSDMANVKVGYPFGTGFTGGDPDDYFIEGRQMRVSPLNSSALSSDLPGYDHVELDVAVSPAEWTQDTHGIFPDWDENTS